MGRLFGTDGVRGIANLDLTPELAFKLGRAAAYVLVQKKGGSTETGRILVGRDTRLSGEMLEAALVAGITSVGVNVEVLGVIPTPGVAYLTRRLEADAAAMISASHNPVEDNGIKFFNADGYKLTDEVEDKIESYLGEKMASKIPRPTGLKIGRVIRRDGLEEEYIRFLIGTVKERFAGYTVVLDCAYGATYHIAPKVFTTLGAKVIPLNNKDDGSRINVKCGSTNPQQLREEVIKHGAQLGLAYDGDGDRLIAVDEKGNIVDGDFIMGICGLQLLEEGALPNRSIAVTVYSNLGLAEAFRKAGGDVVITENGDRRVLAAMLEKGLALGGEQSGHIIFLEYNTTGDGLLTSLQLMGTIIRARKPLSELKGKIRKFPQLLENVHVKRKEEWMKNERINQIIGKFQQKLGNEGRIFVRASGTEPLIRVMVEGPEQEALAEIAKGIAKVIEEELS